MYMTRRFALHFSICILLYIIYACCRGGRRWGQRRRRGQYVLGASLQGLPFALSITRTTTQCGDRYGGRPLHRADRLSIYMLDYSISYFIFHSSFIIFQATFRKCYHSYTICFLISEDIRAQLSHTQRTTTSVQVAAGLLAVLQSGELSDVVITYPEGECRAHKLYYIYFI